MSYRLRAPSSAPKADESRPLMKLLERDQDEIFKGASPQCSNALLSHVHSKNPSTTCLPETYRVHQGHIHEFRIPDTVTAESLVMHHVHETAAVVLIHLL